MDDGFFCNGYGVEMSLWNCVENQLSDFCLPCFPCHECPAAITLRIAPQKRLKLTIDYDRMGMTPAVARAMGLI